MITGTHPSTIAEEDYFSFIGIFLSVPFFIAYFVNEMILALFRLTKYEREIGTPVTAPYPTWRMINAVIYAVAIIILALQVLSWSVTYRRYEFRKLAKRTVFAFLITAIFVIIFEYLQISMPVQPRDQSDITVPFFTLVGFHLWSFVSFKQVIEHLGKHYKTRVGDSIFYILFASYPFIKFGLPIILLIFVSLAMSPYAFILYSEITMAYLVGFISIALGVVLINDVVKIGRAQDHYFFTKESTENKKED
ncbi:MAG: hypothetical protein K9W45_02100 [Candidatus Heimdallarchaeum aukensis]|uniref:Uncharacterized protein n=1 Tax=Candidatus Heimdallarchaeum aukensis TaxID=2876573 RepID=A0A9Y1BLI1_9ARCH|nr:MAG: hypothetical protein K9W45_02100 [Candidatus Heimdallarchaeum aukensis]